MGKAGYDVFTELFTTQVLPSLHSFVYARLAMTFTCTIVHILVNLHPSVSRLALFTAVRDKDGNN